MKKDSKRALKEFLIPKDESHKFEKKKSAIERVFTKYFLIFGFLAGILLGSSNFMTDLAVK